MQFLFPPAARAIFLGAARLRTPLRFTHTPPRVNHAVLNKDIQSAYSVKDLAVLCFGTDESGKHLNGVNVSTALLTAARLKGACRLQREEAARLKALVHRLCEVCETRVPKMDARSVTNVLIAHVRIRIDVSQGLWKLVQERARACISEFAAQQVCTFTWSMSRLSLTPATELRQALEARALEVVNDMTAQGVANYMWALASSRQVIDHALIEAISQRAVLIAHSMDVQNASNVVWSLASIRTKGGTASIDACDKAFHASIARLRSLGDALTPHHATTILWAGCKLDIDIGEDLSVELMDKALAHVQELHAQALAGLMVAAAKLCRRYEWMQGDDMCRRIVDKTALKIAEGVQDLTVHVVCDTLWAARVLVGGTLMGEQTVGLDEGEGERTEVLQVAATLRQTLLNRALHLVRDMTREDAREKLLDGCTLTLDNLYVRVGKQLAREMVNRGLC